MPKMKVVKQSKVECEGTHSNDDRGSGTQIETRVTKRKVNEPTPDFFENNPDLVRDDKEKMWFHTTGIFNSE